MPVTEYEDMLKLSYPDFIKKYIKSEDIDDDEEPYV
jgi:hypothetical protein